MIWTIQVVHYPLFGSVGEKEFTVYHRLHSNRISLIVVPMMLAELISSIMIVFYSTEINLLIRYLGLFCVAVVWISTFFLSVPEHNTLNLGLNQNSVDRLVYTNWIRTIAWTIHSFILLYVIKNGR
ncbi:MAG: hypothetical protein SFU98_07960 [Leptospiraceae bacterium]|nr:hypothetical protein [Leptospiraceae bacterium]